MHARTPRYTRTHGYKYTSGSAGHLRHDPPRTRNSMGGDLDTTTYKLKQTHTQTKPDTNTPIDQTGVCVSVRALSAPQLTIHTPQTAGLWDLRQRHWVPLAIRP